MATARSGRLERAGRICQLRCAAMPGAVVLVGNPRRGRRGTGPVPPGCSNVAPRRMARQRIAHRLCSSRAMDAPNEVAGGSLSGGLPDAAIRQSPAVQRRCRTRARSRPWRSSCRCRGAPPRAWPGWTGASRRWRCEGRFGRSASRRGLPHRPRKLHQQRVGDAKRRHLAAAHRSRQAAGLLTTEVSRRCPSGPPLPTTAPPSPAACFGS